MANPEASLKVVGNVARARVAQSGKAAWVTVDVASHPRNKKIEMIAFREQVANVRDLRPGQDVEITGDIDMESLKTKKGEEVKIDGFAKWVPMLVVRAVTVSGATRTAESPTAANASPATAAPGTWDDGDVPF